MKSYRKTQTNFLANPVSRTWWLVIVQLLSHVWFFCNPMDCSMPGFPVLHRLLELAQTHVLWVDDAIQATHPLLPPSPAFNPSQHQDLFQWVSSLHQLAEVLELQLQSFHEYSGLISFRIDWFDFLAVQRTLKRLLQHHSLKASVLRCLAFFMVKFSHPFMTTGKTITLTILTFVNKVPNKLFGQPNISNWVAYKQKCISHSSGSWEVQDQGISRLNIWWGPHLHKDKNTRELSEVSFHKDTNPIHKGSALLS